MNRLTGKVALITGGAGGIGAETARLFVSEGALVVIADLQESALQSVVREIGSDAVSYVVADVSDEAQMMRAVDATVERHGRLDVLFANAGTEGRIVPLVEYTLEDFQRVIHVNVLGVFLGLKYTIPVMQKQGGGSIIVTSSIGGLKGFAGLSAYVTSKHAIVGMMRSAVLETGNSGVRINTIHPSPIETRMMRSIEEGAAPGHGDAVKKQFEASIPAGRYGTPAEVAQTALFLASDESRFCTGGRYTVDGGMSAA
ncbi:SDR family NAD(P)-dependent oxidoreductase [Burkholderia multivorans]|uniref:SDR family NAD(P)-dependent oxidoreductase n=1 Tax=Burkholderia multivorans TaxID=87883 RepID=UPI0004F8A70A|nr:SDR family NAD(P)-dependent oxidoreductase [Burkholderia multivorans]AIO72906.1 polysaccharide biosynthesis family protein [Burkholderia multivorans]